MTRAERSELMWVLHVPAGTDPNAAVRALEKNGARVVGRFGAEVMSVWVPRAVEAQAQRAVPSPARLMRAADAGSLSVAGRSAQVALAALVRRAAPEYLARKTARPRAEIERTE